MPFSAAASRYQSPRQLRQKPAMAIMSMFCTSVRWRRCATRRRNTAASSASWVWLSISPPPSRGRARLSDINRFSGKFRVLLNELEAQFRLLAHQAFEQAFGLFAVFAGDMDLQQGM